MTPTSAVIYSDIYTYHWHQLCDYNSWVTDVGDVSFITNAGNDTSVTLIKRATTSVALYRLQNTIMDAIEIYK